MSNRAKEIAAIMATYEPGQVWQCRARGSAAWDDILPSGSPIWDWWHYDYRRKPEPPAPKYRPWTPEEGVGMRVRHKADTHWCSMVVSFTSLFILGGGTRIDAEGLLLRYTQLDGTPCGVLETPTTTE